MYKYDPFMVTSLADGKSRHIYAGLYTIEVYDEGYLFHTWVTT
jgi:hypothetical protein